MNLPGGICVTSDICIPHVLAIAARYKKTAWLDDISFMDFPRGNSWSSPIYIYISRMVYNPGNNHQPSFISYSYIIGDYWGYMIYVIPCYSHIYHIYPHMFDASLIWNYEGSTFSHLVSTISPCHCWLSPYSWWLKSPLLMIKSSLTNQPIITIPYALCMEYLPTFGWFLGQM